MFVVMATQATEAEVNGVKGRILAEGLTPFEHVGTSHTVIAVVGEIGARRPELMSLLGALSGVEKITPISRPYKLVSREVHPEAAARTRWPRASATRRTASSASSPP